MNKFGCLVGVAGRKAGGISWGMAVTTDFYTYRPTYMVVGFGGLQDQVPDVC